MTRQKILKKKMPSIIIVTLISVVFIFAGVANAQENDVQNNRIEEINNGQSEKVTGRTGVKTARKEALQKKMQDRIINLTSNITSKIESAFDRFEDILGRLESRVEKLEVAGVEVEVVHARINDIRLDLSLAKETLPNLYSVTEAVSGDSPREKFKEISSEIKSIHAFMKQTHTEMREMVTFLKEAVRKDALGDKV